MKNSDKKWLEHGSWETLVATNQAQCEAQKVEPLKSNFDKAREYWQSQASKSMSFAEALEVCRKCNELHPFTFNNGNTFAAFVKSLSHAWAETLAPLEAQILRTTIAHYVNGQASKRELLSTFEFLAVSWERYQAASVIIRPERMVEAELEPSRQLAAS